MTFIKYLSFSLLAFIITAYKPTSTGLHKAVRTFKITDDVKPADKYLIVPGVRIGKFVLDSSARGLPALLGKPAYTDSSMGSALLRWNIKRNGIPSSVIIFADKPDRKAPFMMIRKILITSPLYKTAEGLRTGLPFDTYAKSYKLKVVRTYVRKNRKIIIYNEKSSGISFEIDDATKTGTAIAIYKPKDPTGAYINMH